MTKTADRIRSTATVFLAVLLLALITTPNAAAQTRPCSTAPMPHPVASSSDSSIPPITLGTNVNVTNETGAQSETSVAVDPTNPMHVLESENDLTNTATVYESVDGGATW